MIKSFFKNLFRDILKMPVKEGKDLKGYYFQWGNGKRYYFDPRDQGSIDKAKALAMKQANAILMNGYKRK